MLEAIKNIKNLGAMFPVFMSILESVKNLVEFAEQADPEDGKKNGQKKLQFVIEVVNSFYDLAERFISIPLSKEELNKHIENLVNLIVDFYNMVGKFTSKSN